MGESFHCRPVLEVMRKRFGAPKAKASDKIPKPPESVGQYITPEEVLRVREAEQLYERIKERRERLGLDMRGGRQGAG